MLGAGFWILAQLEIIMIDILDQALLSGFYYSDGERNYKSIEEDLMSSLADRIIEHILLIWSDINNDNFYNKFNEEFDSIISHISSSSGNHKDSNKKLNNFVHTICNNFKRII